MSAPRPIDEPNFVMVPPDRATESVERLRRQALRLLTEQRHGGGESAPGAGAPPPADRAGARAPASSMIAGVIAMPAAFLAVVFGAIALFGKPGRTEAPSGEPETLAQPLAVRAASPIFASASGRPGGVIALPEDARIASIALDGDRVALQVESPAGREILVYDYREGRQVGAAAIETLAAEVPDTLGMLTGAPTVAAAVDEADAPAPVPAPRMKPRAAP